MAPIPGLNTKDKTIIGTLITIILYLFVAGLVWWAARTIMNAFPIAEPIKTVINVLMTVVLCLIVIYALLPLLHVSAPILR